MYTALRSKSTLTGLALALGLGACAVETPVVGVAGPSVMVEAPVQPPPPQVEVIPVAPGPDFFWVYGHWRWTGTEHRWEGGHWERHHPNEHWVPYRWDRDEHGRWHGHEGFWRRN